MASLGPHCNDSKRVVKANRPITCLNITYKLVTALVAVWLNWLVIRER